MQEVQNFDLVVIGAGPAGYTAAIKAAQLGMRVACVEKRSTLGGTCLNVGCIPSKALLHFSHLYDEARHKFAQVGINGNFSLDLPKMLSNKNKIVSDLCKGIEALFAKNKVMKFIGSAKIIDASTVKVNGDINLELKTRNILIATGSQIAQIDGINIDEEKIVSSSGVLDLKRVPEKMLVIGAGYIGLELGSVWRRLGSHVTVAEYAPAILSQLDQDLAKELHKSLQKQGMEFKLGSKITSCITTKEGICAQLETNGVKETIQAEMALVCVGRKPFTQDLGLQELGIKLDAQSRIIVDSNFRTNVAQIFAVGDVIAGPMLAHKAEEEAICAVEIMAGEKSCVNYLTIPSVIYTSPEVASVGFSQQQLDEQKIAYKIGKFPFLANSKARTSMESEGFVKILADKKSDRILGAHIIGQNASVMISQLTLGMEFGAAAEDIARTCHPHPTLSEAVRGAAQGVNGAAINF